MLSLVTTNFTEPSSSSSVPIGTRSILGVILLSLWPDGEASPFVPSPQTAPSGDVDRAAVLLSHLTQDLDEDAVHNLGLWLRAGDCEGDELGCVSRAIEGAPAEATMLDADLGNPLPLVAVLEVD